MERSLIKAHTGTRDLRPLFDPKSVAILGASGTPGKWGYWLANNALRDRDRRRVYLVNRGGGEILGERAYSSLRELPEPPELVVITIGASSFERAVEDSLAAGARAIIGITAGLGEMGGEMLAAEQRAADLVRAAGAALVGPNCLGIADTASHLNLAFGDFAPGAVALLSQSGNLGLELVQVAKNRGLGFSRFVSVGNQADLHVTELIDSLVEHEPTSVIAVYVEDFGDGRAFARAALRAHEAGKAVVLLTVGASGAAAQAARSHTGALVSDSVAVDAACRAAGVTRVATPTEMIELAQALLTPYRPRGPRVGIAGDGGGHVALASDQTTQFGLIVPAVSSALSEKLASTLPSNAATRNPVDLAGGGEQDFFNYARVVEVLLESGEVDAALLTGYFGGYSEDVEELARREAEVASTMANAVVRSGRPLIVQSMYPGSPTLDPLRVAGIPIYGDVRSAAFVLSRLVARERVQPTGVPDLPSGTPAAATAGYFEARHVFEVAGIPLVEAHAVKSMDEAVAAAATIGYPVVVKAIGAEHKSDGGGVRVNIKGESDLRAAIADMQSRIAPTVYSVERMSAPSGAVELLVGARRDHSFGPILLVGAGGVYTEVLNDVAVALAPVTPTQVEAMLRSLRIAPLLTGVRGSRGVDIAGAARIGAAISHLAATRPDLAELEINPLQAAQDGCVALDARIVPA